MMDFAMQKSSSVSAASIVRPLTAGNAPRSWKDYLAYPRVLFTLVLCALAVALHVAFGIYVWFFEK
jgi:hypothetical protein